MKVVLSALLFIASACWAGLQTDKITATELGNRWYQHDQFGTFYDANNSDWYYHLDHGWIYVERWDDNGTWMYMPLVNETPVHTYMHFDGVNYSAVFKWDELAASTGLSIDFLKAITEQSGADPNTFTNEGNQTINVTDTAEPFGWVWTNSSTQNFLYNNGLEEWFYFNKDMPKSEARFYSYSQKCYITPKEIRKRDYAQDTWKEMLSSYGLEKLNDLNRSVEIDENKLGFSDGTPIIITVNIPKVEIQEDDFWFPLINTLTEQHTVLKNYYRLFEDENFYTVEIRSVLLDSVLITESYGFSDDNNQGLVSVNDDRQAAAIGLNDNGTMEEIVLERAGIIDLGEADYERKLDKYIEVVKVASNKFEEKAQGRDTYRKDAERFTIDLVSNFEQVVDLVIEAESIGINDDTALDSLLENSDNTKEINEIQKEAQNLGIRDKESLAAVFRNADKADELKEVIDVAAEIGLKDEENLRAVFQNVDKADDLKQVIDRAVEIGAKDKENLQSVLQNADKVIELKSVVETTVDLGLFTPEYALPMLLNADKSDSLKKIIDAADEVGLKDKENLAVVFQNADKAVDLKAVIDFAEKYGLKTDTSFREVLQQTDRAEELNELILAETLQTIDDLDEETIQQALQSPTAIAYTLPAAEVLKVSLDQLKVIDKGDVVPEIKSIAKGIKIGDINFGVVADFAVSSKASGGKIKLTEIKDRAEIVQVYQESGLSGETLSKIIAELKDPTNSFSITTNEKSESISRINVPETRKWQNAHVTVEGTSLEFSGDASAKGDVVLENVTHSAVSDLNSTEFNLYTEQY